jgi:hypothetical protein
MPVNSFRWKHYAGEIILLNVRWYLKYALSGCVAKISFSYFEAIIYAFMYQFLGDKDVNLPN